jgi:hypothetical protein
MTKQVYQVVYFPYLALDGVETLKFGPVELWNARHLEHRVRDENLRKQISAILATHVSPAYGTRRPQPLQDIGVVTVGGGGFLPLSGKEARDVEHLRNALFLACLSHNVRSTGPNAGHEIYTTENFRLITHNFVLDSKYFSGSEGSLVQFTELGYELGKVTFPRPSFVPHPLTFSYDSHLWLGLQWLRRTNSPLFRRIMRASSIFSESYYNTPSVDLSARILLQVVAFEVLLDLPEKRQRQELKAAIERLCTNEGERRFRYKYEVPSGKKEEALSLKGIWADRFYTLRNHIIHGERVRHAEFSYRGQRHLTVSPMMFIRTIKSLIDEFRGSVGKNRIFFDRVDWVPSRPARHGEDEEQAGFRIREDFEAMYREHFEE